MCCIRVSRSDNKEELKNEKTEKTYVQKTQNHPLDYFLSAKEVRFIHPETSDLLEHWLRVLAEQGEEQAFALIRETLKQEKSKNQKSR